MAVRGAPIPLCGGVGNGLAVADEDELGNNDCVLKMNRLNRHKVYDCQTKQKQNLNQTAWMKIMIFLLPNPAAAW